MKIGIITDIHSNIQALNAVLNEFDKIKVDKIICCGDIIGIGANPEETVQALIKRKDILILVRGNHEKYLLDGLPKEVHDNKRKMSFEEIENHNWTHSQLSQESKEFIKNISLYQNIEIEGKKIYIVHYPIDEVVGYKKHIKNATIEECREIFSDVTANIYIYGHTHIANVNNENDEWHINLGSLGCPMKNNIANAGVLGIDENGIYYKQLNIEYNVNEVIQEIERVRFPFYRKILKIFYGKE